MHKCCCVRCLHQTNAMALNPQRSSVRSLGFRYFTLNSLIVPCIQKLS